MPIIKSHPEENRAWPWTRGTPKIRVFPFNISATVEASYSEIGIQLRFAKAHHKISPKRNVGVTWSGSSQKCAGSINISATELASDLKFGTQLGFSKAHHKIILTDNSGRGYVLGKLPDIWRLLFNISAMAEASYIKFHKQLGFAEAHYKNRTQKKNGRIPGLREFPKIWRSVLIYCYVCRMAY